MSYQQQSGQAPPATTSASTGGSSSNSSPAFSRLSRPGSGRLQLTAHSGGAGVDGAAASSSSTPTSLSPATSPMMQPSSSSSGLVPEHRVRPMPPTALALPSPGGGLIPSSMTMTLASPEQQEKRQGLKISFSQPNIRALPLPLQQAVQASAPAAAVPLASSRNPAPLPLRLAAAASSSGSADDRNKLLLYQSTAHSTGKLKVDECEFDFSAEDLTDDGEIGRGAFGSVNKMVFRRDGGGADGGVYRKVMAVKRIRSTVDEREQKELLMDLEVVMRSNDCPFIVLFFGAIFKEGDCWICMELMDTSTDKFYKFIYDQLRERIPENVIGKITVATVKALNYLKEKLKIIHRDVKPSNILLDRCGNIKLCDFGISGQLVDSIAKTRDAGCRPYMAPERIDPQRAKGYDVRSDVWSLGITLIELATGFFPYPKWNSVFEQLQQVVHGDPPRLDLNSGGFTIEFVNFVNTCLIKDETQRPKYTRLLEHPFIKRSETETVDVAEYVTVVLEQWQQYNGNGSGDGQDLLMTSACSNMDESGELAATS